MGIRIPHRGGEQAFTLIELIVGMAITGVIVSAIAGALIVGLSTTDATAKRLSESHDAQISSAYLANDVQSAESVNVTSSNASCSGGNTPLITFTYSSGGQAAWQCGTSNGETQVTRTFGGGTVVVAHFAGSGRPSITCTPSPCAAGPLDNVSMGFTEASGFSYTLVGSRRAYTVGGPGPPSPPDLTLLAMGDSPLTVKGKCTGNDVNNQTNGCTSVNPSSAKLTVNGNLLVNTAIQGAVKVTGGGGKGFLLTATGAFQILQGGTCQGCNNGNVSPFPPGSFSPAYLDPLRFMADPTGATTGSCSGGVCQPGVYASQLTLNSSATLQPGIYILNNGMSVAGNATVTGTGVMLFVRSGNLSFSGGSSVNLAPPASGQYKNILIFQSRSDTSAMTLSGGTSLSTSQFGGVVYAPASSGVTLGTGGAFMHVMAVIARNVTVTGDSQVSIG